MKISTAFLFDRATSQMSVVQNRLANSQAQLAQGKQVIAPSDAPDQASTISRLKGILAKHDSYTQALQATRTRFQTEEIALQNVSDGLVRMRELVIQAANDTMGPVDRQALAIEMAGLRDQIMSLANTQDTAGAYIFAGSRVREPAFAMDAQGTLTYQGDETTIDILVGDQRTIKVNRSGSDVFQRVVRTDAEGKPYGVGFFKSLSDMVDAVANSDDVGMNQAIKEVDALQNGVALSLAQIGTDMNVLDSQEVVLEETTLRLKNTLSGVEDLDYAEAITQMNKEMLALEAAQSSFAKISQLNLFNYIN
jgi:flagellar hook-associated protein 3 FlgL